MQTNPYPDFKLLFETLPGNYLVLSPELNILAASNSYLEVSMTKRDEILGRNVFEVFPDNPADENADGASNLQASLRYVIEHRQPHKMAIQHYDVRRPDGIFEKHYWSPLNTPVLKDTGELCCILHYVEDVTEKQKKQTELDFLSLQIERAQDAIYTVDTNLTISNWNYGAEKLYGFTKAEAIGQEPNTFLQTDIRELDLDRLKEQIDSSDYQSGEFKRKHKAGKDIYVRFSISTIRYNGIITGYVVVSFDITEQKNLRDQVNHLASIVDQSSEAIFSRGLDMKLLSWNKGAEELFGYSREEVLGKNAREIGFSPLSPGEIEKLQNEIIRSGAWKSDLLFTHKNGSSFYGSITGNVSRNKNGEITSFYFIVKDISLRKKLEEELKGFNEELEQKIEERTAAIIESESKYQYLFDNNPLPMWVVDTDSYRFVAVNKTALDHYGYSRDEFLSMTALEIRPEKDRAAFLKIDRSVKEDSQTDDLGVWNHVKKDGTVIKVRINVHPINFENRPAALTLVNDVTQRIKTEEKLIASEKRFRTLIENANDAIILMDDSLKIIYRSPGAERMSGWRNEELLDQDGTMHIHPDFLKEAGMVVQQVMANHGVSFKTSFRYLHKKGHYIWIEGYLTNWLHDKNVEAIVFNSQDVTERVEAAEKIAASEERFRSTMDNMIEGVQIIGFDWKYIYANKAFTKHSKYSTEELIGKTVMEKFPGIENTPVYKIYQQCFNERVAIQLENEFEFFDKTTGWFELSFQPVPEGIFILSVDITERKKSEAALEVEKEKLDKIAATAPGLIYSLRMNTEGIFFFTYASNAFEDIVGFTFDEVKDDVGKIFSLVRPDQMEDLTNSILLSAEKIMPWSYEYEYNHPAKGKVWLYGHAIPVRESDGCTHWHGIISDITGIKQAAKDLKRSNDRFQLAMKASSDIVWELNFETREYLVYEDREKLFGSEKEINWKTGTEGKYIIEKDRERIRSSFNKAKKDANCELWNDEYEVIGTDGSILKVINHAIFTRDKNGKVTRAVGAIKDVTTQRKLETELRERQHREQLMITATTLDAQEKERNAIGMELHDNVNQLLVGTYMLLRMIKNSPDKTAEFIASSIDHVKAAIDENRKIAHELVTPDVTSQSLPELISQLSYSMLASIGVSSNIDSKKYKEALLSDLQKLAVYRVVQEQCTNIIKYAGAQQVSFILSTAQNVFTMQINDDGAGMTKKQGEKAKGIGLGNIAARMSVFGGKVDIDSKPGEGFKLTIKIPLTKQGA